MRDKEIAGECDGVDFVELESQYVRETGVGEVYTKRV